MCIPAFTLTETISIHMGAKCLPADMFCALPDMISIPVGWGVYHEICSELLYNFCTHGCKVFVYLQICSVLLLIQSLFPWVWVFSCRYIRFTHRYDLNIHGQCVYLQVCYLYQLACIFLHIGRNFYFNKQIFTQWVTFFTSVIESLQHAS